jgi:tetratricopeptide (TPR) repeat protein
MAPEQARPNKALVGPATDIYALGAILYEVLTGRPPFVGENALDVLLQVSATEPVPPSRLVPSVPRDLETVCLKCLQKDPRQCYATAAELAEDLRRFQEGRSVRVRPVGVVGQVGRWCRRNPGTALAVAAAVVALLAGRVVSLLSALLVSRTATAEKEARAQADRNAEQARLNAEKADAEKARADDEADLGRGVNTFLRFDLLLQADPQTHAGPGQSPDRDIKTRRILDQAARRIQGRFPGRPLVEAGIRNSIGNAYSGLGEFDLALTHLQAAYDIQSKMLGVDHPDSLDTVSSLGVIYHRQARYGLAEEITVQALGGSRKSRGVENLETLLIQSNLAAVYLDQGRYHEAGALLQEAAELGRRKHPTSDRLTYSVQLNLATLYRARGDLRRAEEMLSQLLESSRRTIGEGNPLALNCQHNLASLYQNEGRFDKAEPLLVKTSKARAKYLGPDHPITLNCLGNLANLRFRQGRHKEAESMYLRILQKQRQELGDDHRDTLETQQNLAQLYVTHRDFERAEPLLWKTLETRRQTLGEDHLDTISSQHSLALYYLARQRHAEAEPLFVRVLAAHRARLGDSHPDTLAAQNNLAALYLDMDKPRRAEPLFQRTLDVRRRHFGPDHPSTITCQGNLALIYLRLGAYDRSESLFTEALAGHLRQGSILRLTGLQTRNNIALLNLVQGKIAEARAMYTALLSDSRATLGEKHPLSVQARQTLADLPALKTAGENYQLNLTTKGAERPETLAARLRWAVTLRDRVGVRYAVPHAEAVVATRKRSLKTDEPATLEAKHLLAGMLQRLRRIDEALDVEQDVLDGARRVRGESDPLTLRLAEEILEVCRSAGREGSLFADAAALQGKKLLAAKEFDEAERLLRACLKVREDKRPGARKTFETKGLLGEALLGRKEFAQAEPLLTDAYQGIKTHAEPLPTEYRALLNEAAARLVRLYESWGKPDEARRWRAVRETGPASPP